MYRLILYEDHEGAKRVMICTNQNTYDTLFGNGGYTIKDMIYLPETPLTDWPTNKPLLDDF